MKASCSPANRPRDIVDQLRRRRPLAEGSLALRPVRQLRCGESRSFFRDVTRCSRSTVVYSPNPAVLSVKGRFRPAVSLKGDFTIGSVPQGRLDSGIALGRVRRPSPVDHETGYCDPGTRIRDLLLDRGRCVGRSLNIWDLRLERSHCQRPAAHCPPRLPPMAACLPSRVHRLSWAALHPLRAPQGVTLLGGELSLCRLAASLSRRGCA